MFKVVIIWHFLIYLGFKTLDCCHIWKTPVIYFQVQFPWLDWDSYLFLTPTPGKFFISLKLQAVFQKDRKFHFSASILCFICHPMNQCFRKYGWGWGQGRFHPLTLCNYIWYQPQLFQNPKLFMFVMCSDS